MDKLTERALDALWVILGTNDDSAIFTLCANILLLPIDESPTEHGMLIISDIQVPIVSRCLIQGVINKQRECNHCGELHCTCADEAGVCSHCCDPDSHHNSDGSCSCCGNAL